MLSIDCAIQKCFECFEYNVFNALNIIQICLLDAKSFSRDFELKYTCKTYINFFLRMCVVQNLELF